MQRAARAGRSSLPIAPSANGLTGRSSGRTIPIMASIVFEHVSKRYSDGAEAVTDMNLTIADGEFMILVGPSGSGKSTALRMVAGLEDITEGILKIDDEVVNDFAPR